MQESGLHESFHISPGDDLQSYDNHDKAAQFLGFLTECFEKKEFDAENLGGVAVHRGQIVEGELRRAGFTLRRLRRPG